MKSSEIRTISPEDVARIARSVFGSNATVASITEIIQDGGRVVGCNWNLPYIVSLAGDPQKYVFRFNRRRYGRGDGGLQEEADKYALIAAQTSVPTPRIHALDTSHRLVPTGYVVMDFMPGARWDFLIQPQNPETTAAEKAEIFRQTGAAYAELHRGTARHAANPEAGANGVLAALDMLERVIGDSRCRVKPELIAQCREVVQAERLAPLEKESFCLGDGDLFLAKQEGEWRVSFVCDVEFAGYGDPCGDFVRALCYPFPVWGLPAPLVVEDPAELARRPFFQGYEAIYPIDYDRLAATALYAHIACMCSVAREAYRADEREGMEEREPAIYFDLLQAVLRRRP